MSDHNTVSGLSRVAVYFENGDASAWNGVASIDLKLSGSDSNSVYLDGNSIEVAQHFQTAKIDLSCYTFPDDILDSRFGLVYTTERGDNTRDIHILYECKAVVGAKTFESLSKEMTPALFDLELVNVPLSYSFLNLTPTSYFIFRSNSTHDEIFNAVEELLYGTDDSDPQLPPLEDLIEFIESRTYMRVIDHGDGTWTAIGPDAAFDLLSNPYWTITWPSAKPINEDSYRFSSY